VRGIVWEAMILIFQAGVMAFLMGIGAGILVGIPFLLHLAFVSLVVEGTRFPTWVYTKMWLGLTIILMICQFPPHVWMRYKVAPIAEEFGKDSFCELWECHPDWMAIDRRDDVLKKHGFTMVGSWWVSEGYLSDRTFKSPLYMWTGTSYVLRRKH